jgi:hypothetical protein
MGYLVLICLVGDFGRTSTQLERPLVEVFG